MNPSIALPGFVFPDNSPVPIALSIGIVGIMIGVFTLITTIRDARLPKWRRPSRTLAALYILAFVAGITMTAIGITMDVGYHDASQHAAEAISSAWKISSADANELVQSETGAYLTLPGGKTEKVTLTVQGDRGYLIHNGRVFDPAVVR